jgi:MFS family permease
MAHGNGAARGRVVSLEQARAHRTLALALLTLVYIFNFIDRQILVILQDPIKAELGLSDGQLGILTGFAFAIFYVTVGIPVARIADLRDRRTVIAVSLTIWSGMTALSGLVGSYWQLLLARIGVGIGEAGGSPPAHSIISDLYPKEQRGRALSIYSAGIYLGILVGFLLGGWITQFFGWRMAFFAVGLPGVALAVVLRLALKEPVRGLSDGAPPPPAPSFLATLGELWRIRAFPWFALGCAGAAFVAYGTGNAHPLLLGRVHGMEPGAIGTWLSLIQGGCGAFGAVLGGVLADRLGARSRDWYLLVPVIGTLGSAPLAAASFLAPSAGLMLALLAPAVVLSAMFLGPTLALTHSLVPPNRRAMSSAVLLFILNLIGLGLGPTITGFLSDYFAAQGHGAESIRWAMVITALVGIPAGALFWVGARRLPAVPGPS